MSTETKKQERGKELLKIALVVLGVAMASTLSCCLGAMLMAPNEGLQPSPVAVVEATPRATKTTRPTRTPEPVPTLTTSPVATPTPTVVPTSTPTPMPSALTFGEIEQNYMKMTELQWAEYAPSLSGTRVRWTARVREVGENGIVYLTIGGMSFGSTCDLKDIPYEIAMTLRQNQTITFETTIVTVRESWFLLDYLEVIVNNTKIL